MTDDKKRLSVAPDYEKRGACGKGGDIERAKLRPVYEAPNKDNVSPNLWASVRARLSEFQPVKGHGIEGPSGRRGIDPAIMTAPYGAKHISKPIEADIYSTLREPDVYTARGEMLDFKTWPRMGRDSKRRIWRGLLWVATLALYTGLAFGIAFALFYIGARTVA